MEYTQEKQIQESQSTAPALFSTLHKKAGIDWNRLWNLTMEQYRTAQGGRDCADQWMSRERALAYWNMAWQTQQHRIEQTLSELPLFPGCRVLDIGSGPGVMAIPLARRGAYVTAVDASQEMLSVLSEKAAEAGAQNIACVNKRWEAVDPEKDLAGPYDIVLASLCLAMYDLRAAVSRMEQVCRGRVYLYWFAGEPSWEAHRRLFVPYMPEEAAAGAVVPKCELLVNVLRQEGIDPRCEIFPYEHLDWFGSLEEAVRYFAGRFRIPPGKQSAQFEDTVKGLLEAGDRGYLLRTRATCMKIWWPVSSCYPKDCTEREQAQNFQGE